MLPVMYIFRYLFHGQNKIKIAIVLSPPPPGLRSERAAMNTLLHSKRFLEFPLKHKMTVNTV